MEGRYRYGVGTGTGVVEGDNFFCAFMTPGSGICFVLFYFEGSGRREWMGDGCGSGTGLDPDSIFYCASLSLYYFMFTALLSGSCVLLLPGELAKHAVSEGTCHQSRHRCDFSFEPGRE